MPKKINKIKVFKKCNSCKKPRRLNLYTKYFANYEPDCKICEDKQYNNAMSAMNDYYHEEAKKHNKNKKEIFDQLEKILCGDFIREIHECIEESEGGTDFKIVYTPSGVLQEEGYHFIKHIYVDQTCGCCGDDYYGEVYIPIVGDKYLQFSYQC